MWAFNCCMCYGMHTVNISVINSNLVNCHVRSLVTDEFFSEAHLLLALIFIREHTFSICNWSYDEMSVIIAYLCREWYIWYTVSMLIFSLNCLNQFVFFLLGLFVLMFAPVKCTRCTNKYNNNNIYLLAFSMWDSNNIHVLNNLRY